MSRRRTSSSSSGTTFALTWSRIRGPCHGSSRRL
jgi:hypothetical protein